MQHIKQNEISLIYNIKLPIALIFRIKTGKSVKAESYLL
jgi:hypothetical protein